jgi:molybdopterin converting factor small subunit
MSEDTVQVKVRFITIMQKYSGRKREVEMDLSPEPERAIDRIIDRFHIPWADHLEKFTRIFINKELSHLFVKSGKQLKDGDTIMFIPMSSGG